MTAIKMDIVEVKPNLVWEAIKGGVVVLITTNNILK